MVWLGRMAALQEVVLGQVAVETILDLEGGAFMVLEVQVETRRAVDPQLHSSLEAKEAP